MFEIEIPDTFHYLVRLNYILGIWSDVDAPAWGERFRHLLYFFYVVGFMISVAVGSYATSDKDESVFLVVLTIVYFVMVYRLRYILWHKRDFLFLIKQIGTSYTDDQNEFVQMSDKLKIFTKIVRGYVGFALSGSVPAAFLYPLLNEKRALLFNVAFPWDRTESEMAFWMAYSFVVGGLLWAALGVLFTIKSWYLMLCLSLKYEMLGNRFRSLGMIKTHESHEQGRAGYRKAHRARRHTVRPKEVLIQEIGSKLERRIGHSPIAQHCQAGPAHEEVSILEQNQHFRQNLLVAIDTYDHINSLLEKFGSNFSDLFFLQVITGAITICGSIYTLAFSRHENMVLEGYNCALVVYSVFDIFMIMYLGNEIHLASDKLSYCLIECNWMEQPASCKKSIIILIERLKRPQELTVGKIYTLNLQTFTSIARAAYSMLNILRSFRN